MASPYLVTLYPPVSLLRGRAVKAVAPSWPVKDPADTVDVEADFVPVTGGLALTGLVVAAQGCIVVSQSTHGTVASLRIAGGVDGTTALVSLTALFDAGESRTRLITLPIVAQAPGLVAGSSPTPPSIASGNIYVYTQSTPAAVWTIRHNLDRYPNIIVVDAAGDEVEMDVFYVDANNLTLTAAGAFSGTAYLS